MSRSPANMATESASGTRMVKTENSTTDPISRRRRTKRSASGPTQTAPMATPTSESVAMVVASPAVMPRWRVLRSVGMMAPRTTRS